MNYSGLENDKENDDKQRSILNKFRKVFQAVFNLSCDEEMQVKYNFS